MGVGEQEAMDLLFVRFVMVASCVSKGGECGWVVRCPGVDVLRCVEKSWLG